MTEYQSIGHIHTLNVGLELACNRGSCGGISLKRDECHLHWKRFPKLASIQASFSSTSKTQIWSIRLAKPSDQSKLQPHDNTCSP